MVNGRLPFQKYPNHQCSKTLRRENLFFDQKLSKSTELCYLEPGLYPFIKDIIGAMNTLNQERHNDSENCITVKSVLKNAKSWDLPRKWRFFSTDLGHIFGSNVGNEFRVSLRGKGPHKPELAYIVRVHSFMIYTDLFEYNIVGETKVPLLRCFLFVSKLKSGDIITTGQFMNYQPFNNLQFRPLLKNSFHSNHTDLRETSGEKLPFVSVGITRLVLMFKKASNIHF